MQREDTRRLKERHPLSGGLRCSSCDRIFPVTHDGIPVLWSESLRQSFETVDQAPGAVPGERDVKAANIQVYESIVDDYDSDGIHADDVTRSRMADALSRVEGWAEGLHVDVGCGAGNVLATARDAGAARGLGIDVSLTGLRRTRSKGFDVVLGDAEALPLRSGVATLVTASSVLHHLFDPGRLMAEAFRACKPGGAFLTDFDPSRRAANWGPLALALYKARTPAYRLLARVMRRKVGHGSKRIQEWNRIAEFHNRPGEGFDVDELRRELQDVGFDVVAVHLHDTRESSLASSPWIRPRTAAVVTQLLSLRNPWARVNADTLLTLSRKPLGG